MAAPASINDAMTDRIMLGTPLSPMIRWEFRDLWPRTIAKTCSYSDRFAASGKIRDGHSPSHYPPGENTVARTQCFREQPGGRDKCEPRPGIGCDPADEFFACRRCRHEQMSARQRRQRQDVDKRKPHAELSHPFAEQ